MSHSPSADRVGDADQDYVQAWRDVNALLRSGKSFSGRERNCAYLNVAGKFFANVSSVSGFDSAADGRALAVTDWDADGDLDVWMTNRNAPRIRYLRNSLEHQHRNFVAFQLVGARLKSNRDAIGARVEIKAAGQRLIRTVRAGDGFLAQSSRWLHFGLGDGNRIDSLRVKWPNGQVETLNPPAANGRYRIEQSATDAPATVQSVSIRSAEIPVGPANDQHPAAGPASTLATHNLLTRPFPLPRLPYTLFDGSQGDASDEHERPRLLNLWSTTCATCRTELGEWTRDASHQDLPLAGIDIVVLSIDALDVSGQADEQHVVDVLQRMNVPFKAGLISPETLQKLQLVHNQIYDHERPLPVPTSFLVNRHGQLVAIYKGLVSAKRIADDLKGMTIGEQVLMSRALPSHGRWAMSPRPHAVSGLIDDLVAEGWHQDAHDLSARLDKTAGGRNVLQAKLKVERAMKLAGEGTAAKAVELLREAIEDDPNSARAHLELGTMLGQQQDLQNAVRHLQMAVRLGENKLPDAHLNLGVALSKSNQLGPAIMNFHRSLELDPKLRSAHVYLAFCYQEQNDLIRSVHHFREAIKLEPDDVQMRFNLAVALVKLKKPREALRELKGVLQRQPDMPMALTLAAELLAKQQQLDEAVALLTAGVQRKPRVVPLRSLLAGYLEQSGDTREALKQYREAERLQPGNVKPMLRIAWILSTDPEDTRRDGKQALEYALRVFETQPDEVAVLDVLATAHAEAGDFDEAIRIASRAVELAKGKQRPVEANVVQQRLNLYREGKPFRSPPHR